MEWGKGPFGLLPKALHNWDESKAVSKASRGTDLGPHAAMAHSSDK